MSKLKYFSNFPKKTINIGSGETTITDLSRLIRISPDVLAAKYAYYDYIVQEGERPDHVAQKHYGDVKYYWVVLIMNNIRNIWKDWPLDSRELDKLVVAEYGSITNANIAVYRYIDKETDRAIDNQTRLTMKTEDYRTITMYDRMREVNDEKRRIKLVDPRYVGQMERELKDIFKK